MREDIEDLSFLAKSIYKQNENLKRDLRELVDKMGGQESEIYKFKWKQNEKCQIILSTT